MNTKEWYAEKLKDSRWKKKRIYILYRDKFKCYFCHTTHHLQVHHKEYGKGLNPWEYSMDNLITVCKSCHRKIHNAHIDKMHPNYKQRLLNKLNIN